MNLWDALLLGAAQGATEFLPVSSSGHLALIRALRGQQGQPDDLAFDILLHLATLLAVLIAFRASIYRLLTRDRRRVLLLGLATAFLGLALVPVGGRRLKDLVPLASARPAFVGLGFLLTAALLLLIKRYQRPEDQEALDEDRDEEGAAARPMSALDAAVVGALQLCAIFPGVSRSGATIAAGLMRRQDAEDACEFSFLLSIPAILGAVFLEREAIARIAEAETAPLVVGFLAALITGLGAIALVRWLVRARRFAIFVPYLLLCAGLAFAASLLS